MAETDLPNPSSTIVFFLLATLCYTFFTMFSIYQAKDYNTIENANNNNIINVVYILVLIVGSYFINVSISKSMCSQSIQWSYVLMITLLPWIIIFISLHFILKLFPGWISPFANTIGYIVIGLLGIEKIYNNIFINTNEAKHNTELVNAITNMNSNKPKFINQISIDIAEFKDFFTQMSTLLKDGIDDKVNLIPEKITDLGNSENIRDARGLSRYNGISQEYAHEEYGREKNGREEYGREEYGGGAFASKTHHYLPKKTHLYKKDIKVGGVLREPPPYSSIKPTTDPIMSLYKLLVIKQALGKIVWYILAGILISSISYNLIINMSCEKSLEEIKKDFDTAREEGEQAAESQQYEENENNAARLRRRRY